jgi:hypothetical protein
LPVWRGMTPRTPDVGAEVMHPAAMLIGSAIAAECVKHRPGMIERLQGMFIAGRVNDGPDELHCLGIGQAFCFRRQKCGQRWLFLSHVQVCPFSGRATQAGIGKTQVLLKNRVTGIEGLAYTPACHR